MDLPARWTYRTERYVTLRYTRREGVARVNVNRNAAPQRPLDVTIDMNHLSPPYFCFCSPFRSCCRIVNANVVPPFYVRSRVAELSRLLHVAKRSFSSRCLCCFNVPIIFCRSKNKDDFYKLFDKKDPFSLSLSLSLSSFLFSMNNGRMKLKRCELQERN